MILKTIPNINKKICAQILSWEAHLPFLQKCLESVRRLELFTILAWDVKHRSLPISTTMPNASMLDLVDVFLTKPKSRGGNVIPFIIQNYLTIPIIEKLGFESVYSSSGDIYVGKPEGFQTLYDMFLPYDIMAYWYCESKLGTMIYFIKTKALRLIFDFIVENYETLPPREVEFMVMEAIKYHNLKYLNYMKRNHGYHLTLNQKDVGFFSETMGLRHIHREHKDRIAMGLGVDNNFVDLNYLKEK